MAKNDVPLSDQALVRRVIGAYGDLVEEKQDHGWEAYLLSFMFHPIRGPRNVVLSVMSRDVEMAYNTSMKRIIRHPRAKSQADSLPIWLASPDYPVPKMAKKPLRDVALNDGLHGGGIALISPNHRKSYSRLDTHFLNNQHLYRARGSHIARIVAVPLVETPHKATGYTFKALKRGRVGFDDVWIFPKSRSELPPKPSGVKRGQQHTTGGRPTVPRSAKGTDPSLATPALS
jgi:hypothetical protein